jgi:hypothetical protein
VIFAGFFAIVMTFLPETLPRIVISRAVKKENALSTDDVEVVIAQAEVDVLKEMRFVTTMTFRIMFTEPIVTFLGERSEGTPFYPIY